MKEIPETLATMALASAVAVNGVVEGEKRRRGLESVPGSTRKRKHKTKQRQRQAKASKKRNRR